MKCTRAAFSMADEILRQGITGISDIVMKPGLINVRRALTALALAAVASASALLLTGSRSRALP